MVKINFADIASEREGVKKIIHALVNLGDNEYSIKFTNGTLFKINKHRKDDFIVVSCLTASGYYYAYPIAKERKKDIRLVSYRKISDLLQGICLISYNELYSEYKKLI